MFHVVPKWQIDVVLSDGSRQSIWISDNYLENVLRKVADFSFTGPRSIQRITEMKIWLPSQEEQVGSFIGDK